MAEAEFEVEEKPWTGIGNAIAEFWTAFDTVPGSDIRSFSESYTVDKFPANFLNKFIEKMDAAEAERTPRAVMDAHFKVAEENAWASIREAIAEFWTAFDTVPETGLRSFCAAYTDGRFPANFLNDFIEKLDAAEAEPRAVMDAHFKVVEENVWTSIHEAIAEFWTAFDTEPETDLRGFCAAYTDDPFPANFLNDFIEKIDAAEAEKSPRAMDAHFKMVKKYMKKKARGKKKATAKAAERAATEDRLKSPEELRKEHMKKQKEAEAKRRGNILAHRRESRKNNDENRLKGCKLGGEVVTGHRGGDRRQ